MERHRGEHDLMRLRRMFHTGLTGWSGMVLADASSGFFSFDG